MSTLIPPRDELTILFAHVAYQLQSRFELRGTRVRSVQASSGDDLDRCIGEADVLVVSGLWRDELLDMAPRLRFIQSIGAGVDQFPKQLLASRGIRLASAQGVNERAVSDHAMALILALARRLPEARDNQTKHAWRPMIGDQQRREDELGGKTLLIVGLGGIGGRLAKLAKAFDLEVVGIRRNPSAGQGHADSVHGLESLDIVLPDADFVALTCPLTDETANLMNSARFGLMKGSAHLVNLARGGCVEEPALVEALTQGRIAGAAIDVAVDEPLPADSPLWDLPNIFITPHTAGETRRYEDNVLDILQANLNRLWNGNPVLFNQVV
jgi:phosphoglycerate dehydrogenase-like enzyme